MVESNISANEKNKFSVSLLAFWVKGSIIADNNFVHIDMPNTVLFGLIPAGKIRRVSHYNQFLMLKRAIGIKLLI